MTAESPVEAPSPRLDWGTARSSRFAPVPCITFTRSSRLAAGLDGDRRPSSWGSSTCMLPWGRMRSSRQIRLRRERIHASTSPASSAWPRTAGSRSFFAPDRTSTGAHLFRLPERVVWDKRMPVSYAEKSPRDVAHPTGAFPVPSYASDAFHEETGRWFRAMGHSGTLVLPAGADRTPPGRTRGSCLLSRWSLRSGLSPRCDPLFREFFARQIRDTSGALGGLARDGLSSPRRRAALLRRQDCRRFCRATWTGWSSRSTCLRVGWKGLRPLCVRPGSTGSRPCTTSPLARPRPHSTPRG